MRNHATPAKDKTRGLRRRRIGWCFFMLGLLCPGFSLFRAPEGEAAAAAAPSALRVMTYVQDGPSLTLREEDADKLDQLNYAFALLRDGEASGAHWQSIAAFSAYLERHPHITGVLSVGGWGAEGFSDAAATAEGRERLAESMLALMDRHGFRGLDVDWEYPGTDAGGLKHREEDWENYLALLSLLREGLDNRAEASGQAYVLSIALGASEKLIGAVDGPRLAALVDQVNLMTYDLAGFEHTTGHHAALYPAGDEPSGGAYAVRLCLAQGIPAEKLNLGAAFYGRVWRGVPAAQHGLHQQADTTGSRFATYNELRALLAAGKTTRYFDEEAQSPWLYDGHSFISYEDAASLRAKAAYAREHHLLGIFAWSLEHDSSGELLEAMCTP